MQTQTFRSFDTTSIISSANSTHSKQQNAHGDSKLCSGQSSSIISHPGPLKNTLSILLAESAVFLRTGDLTGRNRYGDSRPTYLRGVVRLELVKPTRISRIVLELGAKVGTIWPEALHGKLGDLTETHKVFSATETVFSALQPRSSSDNFDNNIRNDTSFVTFEDDSPLSSPTITNASHGAWIASDVRSIQSGTSGTITPTAGRRALSADSTWTRRSGLTASSLPVSPPPYSELVLQTDTINTTNPSAGAATTPKSPESPESLETEARVYTESRISFQAGVDPSRVHAPNGVHHHGKRSRSITHPFASTATLPEASISSHSVGIVTESKGAGDVIENPSGYEYAQAHARAHSQQSLGNLSQSQSNHEGEEEPTRGRKKTRSRFSLASFIHSFSKSRSRGPAKSTERETSPSRTSTRSGVSGVTTVSTDTKDTKDSKKSKRSISLPWKRRRRGSDSTTTSGVSGVSVASSTANHADEVGFLDNSNLNSDPVADGLISVSPHPPSNRSYSISSDASTSEASQSPATRSASHSLSSVNKRSPSSDVHSHISFADFAELTSNPIPSTPPSPSILSSIPRPSSVLSRYSDRSRSKDREHHDHLNQGQRQKDLPSGPGWKEFPKGTYTYPILFAIPGHAPPTLDTAAVHQRPYSQGHTRNPTQSEGPGYGGYTGYESVGVGGTTDSLENAGHMHSFPRCTLKWQLKASVHRPGAFATKMQVTHEITVISGPLEDDGTAAGIGGGDDGNGNGGAGGGMENVVVERIWDGGLRPPPPPLPPIPMSSTQFIQNGVSSPGRLRPFRPLPPPPPTASSIPPSPTSLSFLNLDLSDPVSGSALRSTSSGPPRSARGNMTSLAVPPPPVPSLPPISSPSSSPPPPPPFSSLTSGGIGSGSGSGSGTLHYLISISGRSFPIGGTIPIEITLMPLEKVRVHRVGVVIEQKIEYHTQFKRVERTDPILTVPLLSVKHDSPSSTPSKDKELKHILPLESDDPEALRNSPLFGVMKKSLMRNMRRGEFGEIEDLEDLESGEIEEQFDEVEMIESEESTFSSDDSDLDLDLDLDADFEAQFTNDSAALDSSEINPAHEHSAEHSYSSHTKTRNNRNKNKTLSPNALSSLASSLMGPGPWSMSLSLPLPLTHASNITQKQLREYEEKMEVYRSQQGHGGGSGYNKRDSGGAGKRENHGVAVGWKENKNHSQKKEKKPELVDVGRGLLPSNKNKRSNVTISHLLKCVIRVERGDEEGEEQQEQQEDFENELDLEEGNPSTFLLHERNGILQNERGAGGAGSMLADADRSGWDDEWEYVQFNREISRERKVRVQEPPKPKPRSNPKPKKKRKLFDIVVQTPIQILSCRCNPEFASLPGYTPPSYTGDIPPPLSEPSTASTSSSFNILSTSSMPSSLPSTPGEPSTFGATSTSASITTDACPCIIKARMKQSKREIRLRRRERKRELKEQIIEMKKFMERRRSRVLDTGGKDDGWFSERADRDADEVEESLERAQRAERERRDRAKVRRREALVALSSPPTVPLPPPPILLDSLTAQHRTHYHPPNHPFHISGPPLAGPPLMPLPPPPPTPIETLTSNPPPSASTRGPRQTQRTSISSASTSYTTNTASTTHSSYTSHTSYTNASATSITNGIASGVNGTTGNAYSISPSILRNGKTKRSSGFSGLGFGGIITARPTSRTASERRFTGGSQTSQASQLSYRIQPSSNQLTSASVSTSPSVPVFNTGIGIGSGFEVGGGARGGVSLAREFEDLVAGHMDEAGETPPTYEHVAALLDGKHGSS